ncbi:MAG: hypothetical protein IJT23_03980 [Clostridia bacterium]|nr:hypothetical protein [Clostridia bacterium]
MEFKKSRFLHFVRSSRLFRILTDLIHKITGPLSKLLNDIESNYNDHSAIKMTLIGLFRLRIAICLSVVLVMICAACFFVMQNDSEASAQMSLNYEESAKGLNPNSTRFNTYELKSPEVVEKMLYYCGIDPETVDMDNLINSISISPTNSKGFSPDNYYIATSYKVSIKKPADIKEANADDLLAFLCKAYTDIFYSRYADNRSILDFDVEEFDDKEFLLVADLLELKAQQQSKYLNTRVKQSKTFTDGSSDDTFKSLAEAVEDFRNYDIESYRSYVLQTGIAHNKAHYTGVLDYLNLTNKIKYDKDIASYTVRYDGISLYNEAMISIVMIPTIDREKQNYYMSKTKTGMDYMASQADNFLATAQETAKKIETNSDILAKIQAGKNSDAAVKKAYKMIDDMQIKFSEMSRRIESIDKAYVKYKTKDYVTFQMKGMSLMQKIRPDLLIMLAFVLVVGAFGALWIRFKYFAGGGKR